MRLTEEQEKGMTPREIVAKSMGIDMDTFRCTEVIIGGKKVDVNNFKEEDK